MYEALFGRPPYRCDSVVELLMMHQSCRPQFPAACDKRIAQVISTAMATNPDDRFCSAAQIRRSLPDTAQPMMQPCASDPGEQDKAACPRTAISPKLIAIAAGGLFIVLAAASDTARGATHAWFGPGMI